MDILRRSLAPISEEAWNFIDNEAKEVLKLKLKGRQVVDFIGPKGLDYAALNTGRSNQVEAGGVEGVNYQQRNVLPLVELEVPFKMKIEEFEALARGAADVDTSSLIEASQKIAEAENNIIFHGLAGANIKGIVEASDQAELNVTEDESELLPTIISGVKNLIDVGVGGPYTLLLSPDFYSEIFRMNSQGYPLVNKIKEVIGDNIELAFGLGAKGLLLSKRGGDFELIVGQDLTIGYRQHNLDEIEFYLLESLTFRVNTPEAAVVLR